MQGFEIVHRHQKSWAEEKSCSLLTYSHAMYNVVKLVLCI